MLTIYGISSCDSCRRAKRFLDERGIEYHFHDVRDDGLDIQMLERWAGRIDWQKLMELYFKQKTEFTDIPQYPSIRRDVSLLIDDHVSFDDIQERVFKANPKLITKVELHDVYMGKGIPEGKKSYLVSYELQDEKKTLADKAAEKVTQRIMQLLEKELKAEIRKG